MKIFNKVEPWPTKVNFVDENNVILGFDLDQDCCEHADWFILDEPRIARIEREDTREGTPSEMPGWVFDRSYFRDASPGNMPGWDFDAGGVAIFRIVSGSAEKFIHIFNAHNGYYSHGFEFASQGEVIKEGHL